MAATAPSAEQTKPAKLQLVATTYGELEVGERFAAIDDDDPYSLRYRKRRSTLFDDDHAASTPVLVAANFRKPKYQTAKDGKALLTAILASLHADSDTTFQYRYDEEQDHLVIRLPKSERPLQIVQPVTKRQVQESQPSAQQSTPARQNNNKQRAVVILPQKPSVPEAPKTRIRWGDDNSPLVKTLVKLAKQRTDPEQIAKEISKLAGKPITAAAVITQFYTRGLSKYLPKK